MNSIYSDMQEAFELKGFWWLPASPDEQISGVVKFDPDKGVTLESIEGLEVQKLEIAVIDVILGTLQNGDDVSLHECIILKQLFSSSIRCTHIKARYLIIGAHFPQCEDLKFKTVTVRYHNLDVWVQGFGSLDIDRSNDNKIEHQVTIKVKIPEPLKARINEEFELSLDVDYSLEERLLPYQGITAELRHFLSLEAIQETSWKNFQKILARIQDFISFAMNEPTFPTEIKGTSEVTSEEVEGKTYHKSVSLYYISISSKRIQRIQTSNMRFSLMQIEQQFESIIKKWFEKAELLPIYVLYFGNMYAPSTYLNLQFLSLVQAVEAYHRRVKGTTDLSPEKHQERYDAILEAVPEEYREWVKQRLQHSNEVNLRRRLNLLVEEHSDILVKHIGKRKFVSDVVNTRNYFTHYDEELKNKAITESKGLYVLCEKLKTLIEVCFLAELELSQEQIKRMMHRTMSNRDGVFEQIDNA